MIFRHELNACRRMVDRETFEIYLMRSSCKVTKSLVSCLSVVGQVMRRVLEVQAVQVALAKCVVRAARLVNRRFVSCGNFLAVRAGLVASRRGAS